MQVTYAVFCPVVFCCRKRALKVLVSLKVNRILIQEQSAVDSTACVPFLVGVHVPGPSIVGCGAAIGICPAHIMPYHAISYLPRLRSALRYGTVPVLDHRCVGSILLYALRCMAACMETFSTSGGRTNMHGMIFVFQAKLLIMTGKYGLWCCWFAGWTGMTRTRTRSTSSAALRRRR